ncbi:MAG: hypothetical protein JW798_13640, partial [Prolixibacteraceae bacterium]|nr:hypothetical protein [Prolixibacteraceae bacterium]
MMSIIRRISTFLFLCFFVLNSSAAQRLSFNHLSIEDGLANNSVRTMFQDQEGYLWFGTLNGLSRYDGQQFRTFSYSLSDSTSISNNKVREIFQDGLGYLWITTYDNNAHRFDPHTETFINIPAELGETAKNLPVHFVVETSPGEVWIYFTSQGCARINSDVEGQGITVSRFDTGNGLLSNSLYGIWGDSKGQVWISTEAGLQRFTSTVKSNGKAGSSVFFTNPAKQVDAFCVGSDEVWAGSLSGEVYRIIGSWVEKVWESSTGAEVRDIHILQSGDIIAATAQGVLLIDGKQRKGKLFNIYNSQLNSNNIFSVYPDSKGDCWLVTDQRGVTRFQPQNLQFTHFSLNPEIRLSIVEGEKQVFLEDMNGDVWVGIYGGGISRFNRNTEQFEQYLHDENNPASLSSNLILSIFHDRSGNLLAGTYKRGVNIINLEQGNFHSVKGPAGPADDFSNEVRAVFEDHRGWIWTGNKRGHVVVYNQVF